MKELKVHPAAAIFPMRPDDELNELAEGIKANGQLFPIIVKDGVLIDGRNRLEACKRAGVEPRFEEMNGDDPLAFIADANINRRHMSKGALAMTRAMIYPEAEKGGRGKNSLISKEFSGGLLSQARTVLKVLPELAPRVISGNYSLADAYEEAMRIRKQGSSVETMTKELREKAPDLAELIDENKIAAAEAVALYRERERVAAETERQRRVSVLDAVNASCSGILALANTSYAPSEIFDGTKHQGEFKNRFPDGVTRPDMAQIDKALEFIDKVKEILK